MDSRGDHRKGSGCTIVNLKMIIMAILKFKNDGLTAILRISEQASIFRATYEEAVQAYEKNTSRSYDGNANLDKYFQTVKPSIWLVKDEGIYLMSSAVVKESATEKPHLCYAEGYDPGQPDCWEKCNAAVGGDDFVQAIPVTEPMKRGIRMGADLEIKFSTRTIEVRLVYKSK